MSTDNLDRVMQDLKKILDDLVPWDYRPAYKPLRARMPLPSEEKSWQRDQKKE